MSCRKIVLDAVTVELTGKTPRKLVDGLSLTVEGGKVLAVVGESGAGKSMTALAVMGLLPPGVRLAGGEITVCDRPLSRLDAESRRRLRGGTVGMILQDPMSAFDPVFDVRSHFRETIVSHESSSRAGNIDKRAAAALAEVGFSDPEAILDAYPFQMSGGMLQRVMIALSLILEPAFLISDEATANLDTVAQARVLNLLRDRGRERHLGMFLITHDLSVAAHLADEVAVMRGGVLVEHGPAGEIFGRPCHPYTAELMAAHRGLYSGKFANLLRSLAVGCGTEAV